MMPEALLDPLSTATSPANTKKVDYRVQITEISAFKDLEDRPHAKPKEAREEKDVNCEQEISSQLNQVQVSKKKNLESCFERLRSTVSLKYEDKVGGAEGLLFSC